MNASVNANEPLVPIMPTRFDPGEAKPSIASLNDDCRQGRSRLGTARIVMTHGVDALLSGRGDVGDESLGQIELMRTIATFGFPDGDASRERDFGGFQFDGADILFKIDYYDPRLEFGSEDPSDDRVTTRVLTIMLAQEY